MLIKLRQLNCQAVWQLPSNSSYEASAMEVDFVRTFVIGLSPGAQQVCPSEK